MRCTSPTDSTTTGHSRRTRRLVRQRHTGPPSHRSYDTGLTRAHSPTPTSSPTTTAIAPS